VQGEPRGKRLVAGDEIKASVHGVGDERHVARQPTAGERLVAPSDGKAALYVVATRLVSIAPIMVGRATVGSLMDHTWIRADVASSRSNLPSCGRSVTPISPSCGVTAVCRLGHQLRRDRSAIMIGEKCAEIVLAAATARRGEGPATAL
jgi:hypothetical protein